MHTRSRALILVALFCLAAAPAQARRIAAITANNEFLTFDSTSPGTIDNPVAVTGLVPGDTLEAIDFRPGTGALYALGVNGSIGRIYTIDPTTKKATVIGDAPFSTTLISGSHYGFDFNPTVDRIRVTNSSDQNLRVNPNNGTLSGLDTNVDNPALPESIVALAYDRNDRNPNTSTTLFGIDYQHDTLVRIGGIDGVPSPNGGIVTAIGSTGFMTVREEMGFDIADDGVAFASMATAGPLYRLYTIKLTTGAATLRGTIGTGTTVIRDVAVFPNRVANINSGKFFVTIQSAINDAQTMAGDTIVVNADTFQELVTVNKSVTLLGARTGFDARSPLLRGTQETVVNGADVAGGRTSAFHVTVNNVVIDGFTVQQAANIAQFSFGTGIFLDPNIAGTQIRNNIIQDNRTGLIISNNILNKPLIIERNLFRNNNTSGPDVDGPAIYSDSSYTGATFTSVVIDNNAFVNNNFGVVLFGGQPNSPQSNVVISHNIMVNHHNGLYLADLKESFVTDNQITNSTDSQIVLGGGIDDVSISGNVIEDGGSWGIRMGNYITGSPNQNILLGSNAIANNATAGLEIEGAASAYKGNLVAINNWWGQASGPTSASNPGGTGQKLIDPGSRTTFLPFLNSATDDQAEIGFQPYPAPTLYGINAANNNLVSFRADNLQAVTSVAITGLPGGELITSLDFRPATGELFGLSNANRLYLINPVSGKATQRGANGAFSLNGVSFGFDFIPTDDRIRVTSDARQNFRLNPNNGTVAGVDPQLAYASGDPLFLSTPIVGGSAYLNNFSGATRTTLYNIDTEQNILTRQGGFSGTGATSPNTGQLFSLGPLGLNPTDDGTRVNTGFDIFSPVPGVNIAYAALTTNGVSSSLSRVNLVSGAVTLIGPIGDFVNPILVRALAAAPVGQFEFSAPTYLVNETGPVATITINRVGGSQGSVTVDFATANGTAKAGSDYTDSDKVLTFANGVVSKTVQIPITNDNADESFTETILLSLKNPTNGAFLGAQASAVLSIKDDDLITPTLTTQESSPAVAVGEAIFNVAMISGTGSPGGTVTFQLYGPNVAGCSGAPAFTSIKQVNGNGNYASASFTPTLPGAYKWVVTYSGDGDHNGEVSSSCGAANQSFTATVTALGNIATRLRVDTGDNALIAGFIITGTQTKKVIVRGIGTSLPLSGNLANPILELRNSGGVLLDSNDDWKLSANKQAIIDTTIAPSRDQESAIVASLPANASGYTAILRGVNGGTGIGVVEAYDLGRLADSELANISTRGFVSTGDNVLIAGTIVVGKDPQKVIVRAIGPSLGLPNKMQDPTLELRNSNGGLIEANDNWKDSPNKQAIIDSTIPPTNDLESAIVATLPANNASYTAILRGANGTTGIAVVELYALP